MSTAGAPGSTDGTTRVDAGAALTLSGAADRILTDRTLDNRGAITWSNGGRLLMGGTATLTNAAGATINLAADMFVPPTDPTATPSLVNPGTLTKTGGTAISAISIPLTNNGTDTA